MPFPAPRSDSPSRVQSGLGGSVWAWSGGPWTQAGWWTAEVRPEVRDLLWLPVGLNLQQRLIDLDRDDRAAGYARGHCPRDHYAPSVAERVGVPGAPCACQVITVAAWAAVASWTSALADRAVVDAAGARPVEEFIVPTRPDLGTITDPAVEEIAPALRVSPGSARHRLASLRRVHMHPRLAAAVTRGLLIGWHAEVLTTDLRHLPHEARRQVIDVLLAKLVVRRRRGWRDWTSTDLRAQAKRIAAGLDLDLAARRREARRARGLRLRVHGSGAATISADLTDDDATRIYQRLTAIAMGLSADSDDPDDTYPDQQGRRSLDQRRADVFTDLLLGPPPVSRPAATGESDEPDAPTPASTPGSTAGSEIAVIIDAATLLGLAEDPGEVPGCGPLPAEVARTLAADRKWRAWLTTTTATGSQVVATSPTTYRPTAAVARLVRARDPHCRMPGCRSTVTDLDHIVAFPRGQTNPENLHALCRRHHRLKTHARWRVAPGDEDTNDATHTWTSPAGITHTDGHSPPLP